MSLHHPSSSLATAQPGSDHQEAPRNGSLRPGGLALLMLAVALLANTVAGPLATGWIDYPISESMLNQLLGLEVVTVLLVVPAAAIAGVLAVRENPWAPLLGIAPSAYAAYMFLQYVLGPEYASYSLTALAHIAITGLAVVLTLWGWAHATSLELAPPTGRQRGRQAGWLIFLGAFVLLRYLPVLAGATNGGSLPAEFAAARTFFWSIAMLDLGIVVPLVALAVLAILRGTRLAAHAYYAVIGWFAMVPPSVAAMAVVMVARDDPHASVPTLVLLLVASVLFAVPAVIAVRRLSRGSTS